MRETKSNEDAADWVRLLRLLFGAGGIYGSFIYYGALQESVFKFTDENGDKFKSVWFLQVLETFVNVVVAFVGRYVMGLVILRLLICLIKL